MQLHRVFEEKYNGLSPDRMFFAPGRVNLLGEHTDYNGGFVFPAALTLGTYVIIRLRTDSHYYLSSTNFDQLVSFPAEDLTYKQSDGWGNYIKGVLSAFKEEGYQLPGADILVHGTVPNGAGLSSSASLEMAMAFALSEMTGAHWSKIELAKICQAVENHYIGVNSGIMDQFAVGLGLEQNAIFLHTATLQYEMVPLELGNYKLVVTNTNKQRTLADSKYNERRSECEDALKELQVQGITLETLSDLTVASWEEFKHLIQDETKQNRVTHIVKENQRVHDAVHVLKNGDLLAFGELMNASHTSLAEDYEVTGIELDTLVRIQQASPGCIGSRMTGAGFGGCTVSLVKETELEHFCKEVERKYTRKVGYAPSFYISSAGDGVREV
ncbi:galactokinase [Alkalicoccobacillus porphyridii]|uniref:Galactokinase n=2 Tax=Alkalicoccobacillus porphyridii TaxID=2597270 RepID=A0A554A4L1_9BACI|nr:galactokinase [Alkalicoccobacillus porphyridii]